jgi:hypothetical protein
MESPTYRRVKSEGRIAMAENEPPKEKPVRFYLPAGASADAIAKALTEARKRIMAEHAAKQRPRQD